jgi:hypothetical protein
LKHNVKILIIKPELNGLPYKCEQIALNLSPDEATQDLKQPVLNWMSQKVNNHKPINPKNLNLLLKKNMLMMFQTAQTSPINAINNSQLGGALGLKSKKT